MMGGDDLSEYERVRLANIQRNANFLASIGLEAVKPKVRDLTLTRKEKGKRKKEPVTGTRKSSRIRNLVPVVSSDNDDESGVEVDDTAVHYDRMPTEPDELDDEEYLVFISARKWRLELARELEIETYKIFQNRSMADCIRRRRNDISWAKEDRNDLMDTWGIAQGKMDNGAALGLIEILESKENIILLAASRAKSSSS